MQAEKAKKMAASDKEVDIAKRPWLEKVFLPDTFVAMEKELETEKSSEESSKSSKEESSESSEG